MGGGGNKESGSKGLGGGHGYYTYPASAAPPIAYPPPGYAAYAQVAPHGCPSYPAGSYPPQQHGHDGAYHPSASAAAGSTAAYGGYGYPPPPSSSCYPRHVGGYHGHGNMGAMVVGGAAGAYGVHHLTHRPQHFGGKFKRHLHGHYSHYGGKFKRGKHMRYGYGGGKHGFFGGKLHRRWK